MLLRAESDYVTRRRKLELSGQAAPHDDEDVDWCRQNKITPDVYVTEAELTGGNLIRVSMRYYEGASAQLGTRVAVHVSDVTKLSCHIRTSLLSRNTPWLSSSPQCCVHTFTH